MKVKNNHTAKCWGIEPGEVKDVPEWQAKIIVEDMKLGEYVLPPAVKPEPFEEAPKRRRGRPRKVELED